ncbi:hypothetical protein BGW80DRAFT_1311034 [Lactifluus volemus]|nr:hypothetical protein BGW80DRAFT_1311034 [Lactifluus volemus]
MTSVTQISPPIEKEKETFDSPDDGTHADPEKSVAKPPSRRKRKNGEIGKAHGTPPRSRDGSLERGHAPSLEEISVQLEEGGNGYLAPSREDTQKDRLDDEQLFFIDTAPAPVPAGMAFDLKSADDASTHTVPLLLPAHVSVLDPGDGFPVKIIEREDSDSGSESYIEYLDYEDRLAPGVVRYFEASTEEQKHARFLCKRCGAENEHRTNECPVQICLTCGARDEHSTRSCPISKTCFTCGMKGHINKNCPNRHSRSRPNQFDDCDRCGSDRHNTNECPTIWRLYEYVADREREAILQHRESKQSLPLGNGGEGYIARDEWCYNCGDSGHLGDDCSERSRPYDTPSLPSAFGLYNTLSGPFSDAATSPIRTRAPRDWENSDTFGDGWGASAPINVGKRARNKDRMRMEQRALELQERDDQDDWFGNPRNARHSRGEVAAAAAPGKRPRRTGTTTTKSRARSRSRGERNHLNSDRDHDRDRDECDSGLGLRIRGLGLAGKPSRHGDGDEREGRTREEQRDGRRRREENQRRDRDREREPRASRDNRDPRGPQYRGGYARK